MNAIHPATLKALRKALDEFERVSGQRCELRYGSNGHGAVYVEIDHPSTGSRRFYGADGRWIRAEWDDRAAQYQSRDFRPGPRPDLAFSNSIQGLLRLGSLREYRSPAFAVRDALRSRQSI
jgi:hypothetical protein